MELIEFHIRDAAAPSPAHGDPIPRGPVGIGSIEVDLTRASRCQYRMRCVEGFHLFGQGVEDVGADAA